MCYHFATLTKQLSKRSNSHLSALGGSFNIPKSPKKRAVNRKVAALFYCSRGGSVGDAVLGFVVVHGGLNDHFGVLVAVGGADGDLVLAARN